MNVPIKGEHSLVTSLMSLTFFFFDQNTAAWHKFGFCAHPHPANRETQTSCHALPLPGISLTSSFPWALAVKDELTRVSLAGATH